MNVFPVGCIGPMIVIDGIEVQGVEGCVSRLEVVRPLNVAAAKAGVRAAKDVGEPKNEANWHRHLILQTVGIIQTLDPFSSHVESIFGPEVEPRIIVRAFERA